jgi:PAS domain S-box-containing protein
VEYLSTLINSLPDVVLILFDRRLTTQFAQGHLIHTIAPAFAPGRPARDIFAPDWQPVIAPILGQIERGEAVDTEIMLSGANWSVITHSAGDNCLLIMRSVGEQRTFEPTLRHDEQTLHTLFDHLDEVVYSIDLADGRMRYVNQAVARVYGDPPEDFYADPALCLRRVHPDDAERYRAALNGITQQGGYDLEYRIVRADGEERWLHDRNRVVFSPDGRPLTLDGVISDITLRKATEAALQTSEERYRMVSESISDYAYTKVFLPDGSTQLEWITGSFTRITGWTVKELDSIAPDALFHPDDQARVAKDIARVYRGETVDAEYRIITRSGEERWLRILRRPVEEVGVRRYYAVAQDITERKRSELALRESETRYRILSEIMSDYAFLIQVAPDGSMVTDWITADAFTRITGYPTEDMLALASFNIIHPDDRARAAEDVANVIAGVTVVAEYRIVTRSSETRWIRMYRMPVWSEEEGRFTHYYGVAQDITEQKHAENALRERETLYRLLADNATDTIIRMLPDSTLLYLSPAIETLLGYTPDELIGTQLYDLVHPDDLEAMRDGLLHLSQLPETYTTAGRMRHRSGIDIWTETTNRVLRHPVSDEPFEIQSIIRDVTERKQGEQRAIQLSLEQERMRLLAQFITSVSHDFRTPLSIIHTSAHLARRSDDAERRAYHLDKLVREAHDIERLLENVLTMVRLDSSPQFDFTPVNLNDLLTEIYQKMLPRIEAKQLAAALELAPTPLYIFADLTEIHRALYNVIENAILYTPEGRSVAVAAQSSAETAVIEVRDTGIGINPDDLGHIFDPLYKPPERSTDGAGLGLAITRRIIEAHRGYIEVESTPGRGSIFRLILPTLPAEV